MLQNWILNHDHVYMHVASLIIVIIYFEIPSYIDTKSVRPLIDMLQLSTIVSICFQLTSMDSER